MAWKDIPAHLMDRLGYQGRHWFGAWLVVSALMVGFICQSLPLVILSVAESSLAPGEYFRFQAGEPDLASSHEVLASHVVSVSIWTLCGTCQFIPKIRKEYPLYHRISGRIYFLASVPALITGLMLEPKSFGGDFSSRSATWAIGILFAVYGALGLVRAVQRRIQEHKRWMLRMYAVGISVVASRVVIPVAGNLVPAMDLWGTMSCGQIRYELRDDDDAFDLQRYFPMCVSDDSSDDVVVAVKAGKDSLVHVIVALRMGFSVGLWLGLLLNTLVVEFYIHHQVPEVASAPSVVPKHTQMGVDAPGDDHSVQGG